MKKFLSLVLALVMTMSLVTVSAGAADFTDDSSIKYEEAVDVISAAGVVGGYADGSFNPKGTLTRGAAAKILCNLMLGTKAAAALKAAEAPFSDVPVDNVFSAYIAFCANEGIISGYADGTFKPAATLTGFAFMKMLLGAIGYDQAIEGFTGTNWAINVAKLGVAKDLNKGIKDFDGTKYITREEAAQMAFKALTADMVKYEKKDTVTIGDIVISSSSKAEDIEGQTLKDENFDKLGKDTDVTDAYGRPATEWTFDGELVGKYGSSADYTIVASKDKSVAELIEKEKLDKVIKDYTIGGDVEVLTGYVVELYVNDEKAIDEEPVVYGYAVAQIDEVEKIDEDEYEDAVADGAKYLITFADDSFMGGIDLFDIQLKGFDAKTYVEDAYVMFPVQLDDEDEIFAVSESVDFEESDELDVYVDTVIASSISGKVTAETEDYIKVDGKKYTVVNTEAPEVGKEGTFFVDPNGYVIGFEAKKDDKVNVGDVLYVVANYPIETKDSFGTDITTSYIQTVDTKGNVQGFAVMKEKAGDDPTIPTGSALNDCDLDDLTGKIVTVKAAKKDLYKVTVLEENVKFAGEYYVGTIDDINALDVEEKKIEDYRLTKDTTYIAIEDELDDIDVTVKVGTAKIKETATVPEAAVIYKKVTGNPVAAFVFMQAEVKGAADEEILFISEDAYGDAETVLVGEDELTCLSIEAITLDGKTKNILVEKVEDEDAEDLIGFYTVDDVDEDNILTLVEVDEYDADAETAGTVTGTFDSYYETLLTLVDVDEEIETEGTAFADVHDTDTEDGNYGKTVKSLAAMKTAADKGYTVELTIYVNDDYEAQLIVVTGASK